MMPIVAFFGSRIVHFLRSVLFIFFEKPYRTAYALPRACVRAYIILKGTVEAFICSPENIRDSGQKNKAPLHKGGKITTAIAVLLFCKGSAFRKVGGGTRASRPTEAVLRPPKIYRTQTNTCGRTRNAPTYSTESKYGHRRFARRGSLSA